MYAEYITGEEELYDLRKDPYELRNVASDPAYARAEGAAPRADGEALLAAAARLHPVAPHGSRPEACFASRTRSAAWSTL